MSDQNISVHDIKSSQMLQNKSMRWLVWVVLGVAIIGAGIWGIREYNWRTTNTNNVNNDQKTVPARALEERSPEYLTAQILGRTYVTGLVKEITQDGILIAVSAPTDNLELFAVITPVTKFYQQDQEDASKKTKITPKSISQGSFITVVAQDKIGNRNRIDALEIVKIQ